MGFVECEYFLDSKSPDILALCETNVDDALDSGNFSVRGHLHLSQKDSDTHTHDHAVYIKEGPHFVWAYLQKTLQILIYIFNWLYFIQYLTLFFPY